MTELKYEANFVSFLYGLRKEIKTSTIKLNNSAELIDEIEQLIDDAQNYYSKGKYNDAIESYKKAQALIFTLLHTSSSVANFYPDSVILPVGKEIEKKLLEASLKLIEGMHTDIEQFTPPVHVVSPTIPDDIAYYDSIGFIKDLDVPLDIYNSISTGIELLNSGNINMATDIFKDVLVKFDKPKTVEDYIIAGTAALNLSSAYILANNNSEAKKMADVAYNHFNSVNDEMGCAQAEHNKAISLKRLGQKGEAEASFNKAALSYKDVAKKWKVSKSSSLNVTKPVAKFKAFVTKSHPAKSSKPSLNIEKMDFIKEKDASMTALRWPGKAAGWRGASVKPVIEIEKQKKNWSIGVEANNKIVSIYWKNGIQPSVDSVLKEIYDPRINAINLKDLLWLPKFAGETSIYLLHFYAFVIPVGLGDCYHSLGNYRRAEEYYLQAVKYSYINLILEATQLWIKLATNIVVWGDSLYKQEKIEECKEVYAKIIKSDGSVPDNSPLYSQAVFDIPANQAKKLIENISDPSSIEINPSIKIPIITVWARWQYLKGGLDFFGTLFTPIFTFEYLQQIAKVFAEQSIHAEREYINFKVQAELETAKRRDLEAACSMAEAEKKVSWAQWIASKQDTEAMEEAKNLAQLREENAKEEKTLYASAGYWQYTTQSITTAHSLDKSWYYNEIKELADKIEAGDWRGESKKKCAAAAAWLGGKKSYEYQLECMQNDIEEMEAMADIAQKQYNAAFARTVAAYFSYEAAINRYNLTVDALEAFNNEFFTPEIWERMASVMKTIFYNYQYWAIRIAKLMERAYNFETDSNISLIRNEYSVGLPNGLLGSDVLLRDIDSFTYRFIADQRSKETHIKDIISLANNYPFKFHKFLQTGNMSFETYLYEFDRLHPGFFGQRLHSVELEIIGLLPPEGVNGSLKGGIVSHYRTEDGGERTRIHAMDNMALSEYTVRNDAFVYRIDPRMHGLFEGHSVATNWEIDLPKRSNNFDYYDIADVRLVLYYNAKFNLDLKAAVLDKEPIEGEMMHARDFLLRYDFPETWYDFQDSGILQFNITPYHLPRNETNFKINKVALRIITTESISPENIKLKLKLPGKSEITIITNENGEIASLPGNELASVMGGDLLGEWQLLIEPDANSPFIDDNGSFCGELIEQIALIIQYNFDWPQ